MKRIIADLLAARGISLCAPISLSDCRVTRAYLLEREGITGGTAFLFAVPYYTTKCEDRARNISAYAVSADYHLFFAELFAEILPILRESFPENRFAGFTDHSPIAEAEAAVRAGLGFFGCNHLFLTEAYSSYVFLGEIVTDAVIEAPIREIATCTACGACRRACPVELSVEGCLSALTQKKGALSDEEARAVLANGSLWGCDRCQEACPITKRAKECGSIYTAIPFFEETALPHLTAETINGMSEEDFKKRAYSWRGRGVILRNLELFEKGETI
jgi:epoxyqueuosine reductase